MNEDSWRARVVGGLGQGAAFTRLDWAREQFIALFGIDPWPGTLNLRLKGPATEAWQALQARGGQRIIAPVAGACDAMGYRVRLAGRLPAAIIRPLVAGYPADQVEVIAAVGLREQLGLVDGEGVDIQPATSHVAEAVIFDVDGTLVNSVDAYHVAAGRAAAPHGFVVTREQVRRALDARLPFWELVLPPDRRRDAQFVRKLRADTMAHWPSVLASHVVVFDGLAESLARLQSRGLRLAVYTGSTGESFGPLENAGLMDFFEHVLTARDVKDPKPHPDGILRCLELLGVAPARAVYVGDTVPDMQAAAAAGVGGIGVLTGAGSAASLSLAGATQLARDHASLAEIISN